MQFVYLAAVQRIVVGVLSRPGIGRSLPDDLRVHRWRDPCRDKEEHRDRAQVRDTRLPLELVSRNG
jgi:hypothetical protein